MQEIKKLIEIMRALRDPESGCPWDIEQDFSSIAPYTVEEAYEVADAIERGDMNDLRDELGDLLFQVVYHAQLASEQGDFDFNDVVESVNDKLVRRHPHVFGDEQVENKTQLAQRWEQHKQDERAKKSQCKSILDGIASALPALNWSQKLQKRVADAGFDWPNIEPVFNKLDEEVAELKVEVELEDNHARILDEYGDVLFVCVNLGKHLNVNAEQALRFANNKFISRFQQMEKQLESEGKSIKECALDELEACWQKAKTNLKHTESE